VPEDLGVLPLSQEWAGGVVHLYLTMYDVIFEMSRKVKFDYDVSLLELQQEKGILALCRRECPASNKQIIGGIQELGFNEGLGT
jgi:hypothetical protein